MWRFIEEGPLLKFPLRESPFMSADPMYRDVVVAPPIRFQRPTLQSPENIIHSSSSSSTTPRQVTRSVHSSSTVEIAHEMNSIAPIPQKSRQGTNSPNSFSSSGSNVL